MRTRTALFLAGLLLITGAAFADDPAHVARPIGVVDRNPQDVASLDLKVPFILDGVQFPAGTKVPDNARTFVLTPDDIANGTIHAFTSPEVAKVFMERDLQSGKRVRTDVAGARVAVQDTCSWTEEYSWFNTAVGCGNSGVLTLYPFGQYSNLDFGGWNNTISCVKAACIGYYTVLYSCRNFQDYVDGSCADPAALYVPPGFIITDLNNYGFNNRTSSIRFE
jgi:hypothetical protein